MDNKEISKKIEEITNTMAESIKVVNEGMKKLFIALDELIEYNRRLIKPTN